MMRTHNKQVLAAAACLSLLLAGCGKASPEEEMMDYLHTAYNAVSLNPMVVSGDVSEADKFAPLVNSEVPFTVKETGESSTLAAYVAEYISDCKPEDYTYYLLDMDGDAASELCISNKMTTDPRFLYVMKYVPESDSYELWYESTASYTELLGSGWVQYYSMTSPMLYVFEQLAADGTITCSVRFYIEPTEAGTKLMVTAPQTADAAPPPESVAALAEYKDNLAFYPVTQAQWDALTMNFFNARTGAEKALADAEHSYEELFAK